MSNQTSQDRISEKLANTSDESPKSKNLLPIVSGAVVLVAAVACVIALTQQTPDTDERNVVVTPSNVEEAVADLQATEPGYYEVTMNSTWYFENGAAASSNAYVENSTANSNDLYFDIVLSDTDETIFSSPTIPVGSHLENITLDKALEAGTHECVLTYHLLDESGKKISRLNMKLTIVIEN